MKIAVLLGAGASYGCGYPGIDGRPPLGTNLFHHLSKKYPKTWGTIISKDLVPIFADDFEKGMVAAYNQHPQNFSHLLIDMGLYFSEFEPPNNDHYSELVNLLASNGLIASTGFISLNYECVFEIAANRTGLKITMNADQPSPGNILMWKPHGSCNFIPRLQVHDLTIQLTAPGQGYYEGEIDVVQTRKVQELYATKPYFAIPPAMSLYAPGKTVLSASAYVEAIRQSMSDWVLKSDHIITIGTRPNMSDRHIWGPIIESGAWIHYVGGANVEVAELRGELGEHRLDVLGERFATSMESLTQLVRSIS